MHVCVGRRGTVVGARDLGLQASLGSRVRASAGSVVMGKPLYLHGHPLDSGVNEYLAIGKVLCDGLVSHPRERIKRSVLSSRFILQKPG